MKAYLFTGVAMLTAATVFTAGAHADHNKDNHDHGKTITQTYNFDDFDSVAIGGVYEVDINVGPSYSISLTGNEDQMENVKVRSEDGTLYLGQKSKKYKNKKRHNHKGIVASITLPELEALKVSGVASGDIENVDANDFNLSVSGVAEVNIDGICNSLTARVSGVGELDAENLKCKDVDVTLSGVGEVSVYASDSVDVKASGVGDVQVYGKPDKVSKKKAMFTNVSIK